MNRGAKTAAMLPKYRFPEFDTADEWSVATLGDISKPIEKRAGSERYTLMSVTSGVGLISQTEKFGREIAGSAYKNYIVIQKGDFAYNKSATKLFPEGYIAMLTDYDEAALPNSIFTCFRITDEQVCPAFFDHIFQSNYHGSWLQRFIAVGARAHGSLNIDDKHLWEMPVALPERIEQQKIADCLTSLDELIAAENKKLETLKAHKKGLMQKLFPAEGRTVPELRFPQFRESGEWGKKTIGKSCVSFSGGTPNTSNNEYYGGEIPFIRSGEIDKNMTELSITQKGLYNSAAKMVSSGDILVALYGANSGEVALSKVNGAINQAILCLQHETNNSFVYQFLLHKKNWIISTYIQGGQGNLSGEIIKSIELCFPTSEEQDRITRCLLPLDDYITAQTEKIETLKLHKKGLMQGLFPSAREVIR
jgi:type I restriction enzyme S subunit